MKVVFTVTTLFQVSLQHAFHVRIHIDVTKPNSLIKAPTMTTI